MPNNIVNRRFLIGDNNNSSAPVSTFNGYAIFLIGQSNNTSRFTISGNLPAPLQGVQSNVKTFYKISDDYLNNGSFVNLEAGVNDMTPPTSGQFSIGLILADKIFNTYGEHCYLIPTAVGGTFLADDVTPSWYPTHISEYSKRSVEAFGNNAIQQLRNTGLILKPLVLDIHGESDAGTVAHGTDYEAGKIAQYNYIRDYFGFPNMPIIATKLRSDYNGSPKLGLTQLRASQVNIASSVTNYYLFDTDTADYPLDSGGEHYNPTSASWGGVMSAINLGEDLASVVNSFVKPIAQPEWTSGIPTASIDSEATALIAAMTVTPDSTRQALIQDFFLNYKAQANVTSLTDQFGFMAVLAAHDEQAGLLWWNNPAIDMTKGGTVPTFKLGKGFKNTGNGYIDTLFNPTTGSNFDQNNAAIFVWVKDNINEDKTDLGLINATTAISIQSRTAASSTVLSVNQNTTNTKSSTSDARGLWHLRRTASNYVEIFYNGQYMGGYSTASAAEVNGNLYALALNDITGSPTSFSTKTVAAIGACHKDVNPLILYNNLSTYINAVAPVWTPILDTYTGSDAAYGIMKLRTAYAGSCIRVRRSSDSTEQDIGFSGTSLDTTSLLSFVGAGDGYIVKVYDQSGNGNDLVQNTATNQPFIVSSGVTNTINGQPAIYFDGVDNYFNLTSTITASQPFSTIQVEKRASAYGLMMSNTTGAFPSSTPLQYTDNSIYLIEGANTYYTSGADATTTQIVLAGVKNGTAGYLWKNGTSLTVANFAITANDNFTKVGIRDTQYSNTNMQCFIYYASDKTSDISGMQTRLNDFFEIY